MNESVDAGASRMKQLPGAAQRRVAVLGAGIMGACTALYLARRNFAVTLIDGAQAPLSGASRWNEGKIHLGYLYSADASLETARRVMPGGLAFIDRIRELIGVKANAAIGMADDIYLLHRDSVVGQRAMQHHFESVSGLVRDHAEASRYLADARHAAVRPLSSAELAELGGDRAIVAGFRVPERSVRTTIIADALVEALGNETRIDQVMSTRVHAVAAKGCSQTSWRVETEPGLRESFDFVVNALWEGRQAVDLSAGLAPEFVWSNRYRVALFVETKRPVEFPSVVIAAGPFGDIKNYDKRSFYVSWYRAGLLLENQDIDPMAPARMDAQMKQRIITAIRDGICTELPGAAEIFSAARHISIKGGWVFAQGQGSLDDPVASVHRRDRFGVRRVGTYFSVDTGKYSTAPWMASQLTSEIARAAAD